jgi:hypothetical protein
MLIHTVGAPDRRPPARPRVRREPDPHPHRPGSHHRRQAGSILPEWACVPGDRRILLASQTRNRAAGIGPASGSRDSVRSQQASWASNRRATSAKRSSDNPSEMTIRARKRSKSAPPEHVPIRLESEHAPDSLASSRFTCGEPFPFRRKTLNPQTGPVISTSGCSRKSPRRRQDDGKLHGPAADRG